MKPLPTHIVHEMCVYSIFHLMQIKLHNQKGIQFRMNRTKCKQIDISTHSLMEIYSNSRQSPLVSIVISKN